VVKVAASGGPAAPVSPNVQNDNPAWAPDGSSIAVSREAGSTVLISPETGADLRRIDWLRDSAPTFSSFVWSSDGSALAGVIRKGTDLAVVVLGDGLTSQRQIGAPFLGNPTDPASIHPSFVPGFPKLIAASDKTGDLVLLDLQAEPSDQPSRAPYSPIQVLVPAPKGGKLAFPAVRTPRPTGQPGSVVSFVGAGSGGSNGH
jgi:dipeptidyl aminopeptidase/acylaminoacyl peptidase